MLSILSLGRAMSFFPVRSSDEKEVEVPSFSGWTLVLPAISTGNVGQLAMDVLLATYKGVRKVGYYYDAVNVVPYVCTDAVATKRKQRVGSLSLGVEVFVVDDSKVALLQQRAPTHPGRAAAFVEGVLGWVKSAGFANVVLLTSDHAYLRSDEQIRKMVSFQYFTTTPLSATEEKKSSPASSSSSSSSTSTSSSSASSASAALDFLAESFGWHRAHPPHDVYKGTRFEGNPAHVPRMGYGDIDEVTERDSMRATKTPTPASPTASSSSSTTSSSTSSSSSSSSATANGPSAEELGAIGAGISKDIACACAGAGIAFIGLAWLTEEGDNNSEGQALASKCNDLLYSFTPSTHPKSSELKWRVPLSWEYTYGDDVKVDGVYS